MIDDETISGGSAPGSHMPDHFEPLEAALGSSQRYLLLFYFDMFFLFFFFNVMSPRACYKSL